MSTVLGNQIDSAERSADFLLSTKHRDAMFSMDIDDLVQTDLYLANQIAGRIATWQAQSATSLSAETDTVEGFWHALYVRLEAGFRKTAELIRAVEDRNHSVKGKREFLTTWRELRGIVAIDPADIRTARKQMTNGKYRVLGQ